MKKFALATLAAALCLSALSLSISAENAAASGTGWTLDENGTLTITGNSTKNTRTGFPEWEDYDPQIKTVVLTKEVEWIQEGVFAGCTGLEKFIVEDGCTGYRADDGILYQLLAKDSLSLFCYPAGKTDTVFTIPENCSVEDYAFSDAKHLTRVEVPASVYYIGDFAFWNCTALSYISQKESYGCGVYCPKNAFEGCTALAPEIISEFAWNKLFTDIYPQDPYYNAVKFVHKNGLMNGMSDYDFEPNLGMTRAMFVTVLGRLAEMQNFYTDENLVWVTFEDVEPDQWYTYYVNWAVTNDIVKGYGNGIFGVNDKVSIEQAAVILYRYANLIETPAYDMEGDYTDTDEISAWAEDAMRWVTATEIYTGYDGELRPKQNTPRALVAEMLYNYVRETEKSDEIPEKRISEVENPDWGLTLTVSDVTSTEMTLTFTQSGGNPTGELQIGTDFYIEVGETEDWFPVENTINGWTAEAFILNMDGTTEFVIDWEYGYGKLPVGYYRIVKEVMDFRGGGDFDTAKFYVEFAIVE